MAIFIKNSLVLFLFFLAGLNEAAGQIVKLPKGYAIQEGASGSPLMLHYDLDADGRRDAFGTIQQNSSGDVKLMAVMNGGKSIRYSLPLAVCCGSLSRQGRVVRVQSKGMRGFTYYKFRWDARARDFRLIGYETESFGNAANDGSGKSSINLITGDYEAAYHTWDEKRQKLIPLPGVKRKVTVGKRIYMKQFGEAADEWLAALNARYLPQELR